MVEREAAGGSPLFVSDEDVRLLVHATHRLRQKLTGDLNHCERRGKRGLIPRIEQNLRDLGPLIRSLESEAIARGVRPAQGGGVHG